MAGMMDMLDHSNKEDVGDDDLKATSRETEAEQLGKLIEAKDWMGVLDLLKPSMEMSEPGEE